MYVGRRRITSTTSATSFGGRIPLATVHLSLRKTCPKRGEGAGQGRVPVRGPEGHEVLGLAVLNASQLELRGRLGRDAFGLRQNRAHVIGADRGLIGGGREPRRDAARRGSCGGYHGPRHERAGGGNDLTAVVGPGPRRAGSGLLHRG